MRSIQVADAQQMLFLGSAECLRRNKAGLPELIKLTAQPQPFAPGDSRDSDASSPSLTFGDLTAIAKGTLFPKTRRRGVARLWRDYAGTISAVESTGNRVDRAMSKFEVWPLIGDTKAPRTGPRAGV